MKKTVALFLLMVLFGFSVDLYAQQEQKSSSYFSTDEKTVLNKEVVNLLNQDYYSSTQQSTISSIYLSQVGQNNTISVDSKSGSSQRITQKGNDNYYSFKDTQSDPRVNFNVQQTNNGNSLMIEGTNSFMNGISIQQFGGQTKAGQMKIINTRF